MRQENLRIQTEPLVVNNVFDNSEENIESTKCLCNPGTYFDDEKCIECPSHAKCNRNSRIQDFIIESAYWRHDENTLEIYPCKKAYACLGGKIKNNSNDLCNACLLYTSPSPRD